MLDEEPASRRLMVAAGLVRGMIAGAYPCSPERLGKVAELLDQCSPEVNELENLARAVNANPARSAGDNILSFPLRQVRPLDRVPDLDAIDDGAA